MRLELRAEENHSGSNSVFSRDWKNTGGGVLLLLLSGGALPATIFAFFASAMFTLLEFGSADTERSGLAQLPELGSLLCALPAWSPCMCATIV